MFKNFEIFTIFDLAVVEFGVISPFTIKYNLCWGTSTYSNAHAKVEIFDHFSGNWFGFGIILNDF